MLEALNNIEQLVRSAAERNVIPPVIYDAINEFDYREFWQRLYYFAAFLAKRSNFESPPPWHIKDKIIWSIRGLIQVLWNYECQKSNENRTTPTPTDKTEGLTVSRTANLLGVAKSNIQNMVDAGELRDNKKSGSERRIDLLSIIESIERRKGQPGEDDVDAIRDAIGKDGNTIWRCTKPNCRFEGTLPPGRVDCPRCGGDCEFDRRSANRSPAPEKNRKTLRKSRK